MCHPGSMQHTVLPCLRCKRFHRRGPLVAVRICGVYTTRAVRTRCTRCRRSPVTVISTMDMGGQSHQRSVSKLSMTSPSINIRGQLSVIRYCGTVGARHDRQYKLMSKRKEGAVVQQAIAGVLFRKGSGHPIYPIRNKATGM